MNHIVIQTKKLNKTYHRYQKKEGLLGSIHGLWKREYENKVAICDLDLSVEEGEFVGIIGPNGAGKTTLMKLLTGIIAPKTGEIDVLGFYPNDLKDAFKKQYAVVMGQKSQLFFELTVNDTLRLFREIYEIPMEEFKENKAYFTKIFDVEDLMNVQVRTLSLGERMKMELMVALIHNPKVLFLDEPTIGLDAIAAKQIRSFLKTINEEKKTTILLTSHYMEDIKALCKRSIVINHGMKIYDGETSQLFERYQISKKISVSFEKPVKNMERQIPAISYIKDTEFQKIFYIGKEHVNTALSFLMSYEPYDISVEEEDIGVVVERIYKKGSDLIE